MPLVVDLTEVPKAVRQEMHRILSDENARELVQAQVRQAKIAQFYHQHPPVARDGIGGITMSVDPYWANYWRQVLGDKVWEQDEEARKWILKREEWFKVRHTTGNIVVTNVGIPQSVRRRVKTFSKRSDHAHD